MKKDTFKTYRKGELMEFDSQILTWRKKHKHKMEKVQRYYERSGMGGCGTRQKKMRNIFKPEAK